MKLLGYYLSFLGVLTVTYTLFESILFSQRLLFAAGCILGFISIAGGFLLLINNRSGIFLGVFSSAITVGFAAYSLSMKYFTLSTHRLGPDLIILVVSLFAFIVCLVSAPLQRFHQTNDHE